MGIEASGITIQEHAARIRLKLAGLSTLWDEPFDPTNPDHLLVAAYLLGDKHGAIEAYESSLKAILNSVAPPPKPLAQRHWRHIWNRFWGGR